MINPNQIRHNDIDYWDNPYDKRNGLCIDVDRGPLIDLSLDGTKVVFESRSPTMKELETCEHVELTSILKWEPHEVKLGKLKISQHIINKENDVLGEGEQMLRSITPSLIMLKEMSHRHINKLSYIDVNQDDIPLRRTLVSTERHKKKTADNISEMWGISRSRALASINATTQYGTRSAILPLSRRYRADRRFNLRRLDGKFSTDSMYAEVESLMGNKYAQIYSLRNGFSACYPMARLTGDSIGNTLHDFSHDFGVPASLQLDGFTSQVGKKTLMMKLMRENRISFHISEPYRPYQTPAESAVREIKKRWYRIMMKKDIPKRLWDFGLVWICETGNLTVSSSRYANGRTPLEIVTGETPDISEYTDFSFYDWVTFRTNGGLGEPKVGRWLGVSHKIGPLMSYWVLPQSGIPISCITVQRITNSELATNEYKEKLESFNLKIAKRMDVK